MTKKTGVLFYSNISAEWSEEGDPEKDTRYEGEIDEEVPSGVGKLFYPNGDSYEGDVLNGMENGKGKYNFADGSHYVGDFNDDEFSGDGVLSYADGSSYHGEFEEGEYHGYGTHTDSDGEEYEGEWISGELQTDESDTPSSEEEATLIGTLERIVFSNPEDGFLIGSFLEEKSKNSITIKGHIIGVKDSQTLQLKGFWEIDPKYGKQFRVKVKYAC